MIININNIRSLVISPIRFVLTNPTNYFSFSLVRSPFLCLLIFQSILIHTQLLSNLIFFLYRPARYYKFNNNNKKEKNHKAINVWMKKMSCTKNWEMKKKKEEKVERESCLRKKNSCFNKQGNEEFPQVFWLISSQF